MNDSELEEYNRIGKIITKVPVVGPVVKFIWQGLFGKKKKEIPNIVIHIDDDIVDRPPVNDESHQVIKGTKDYIRLEPGVLVAEMNATSQRRIQNG